MAKNNPTGTIVFTTIGRLNYGFDIFSYNLSTKTEHLLTDGISVNFNGSFLDEDQTLVYISERTGSPRVYLNRVGNSKPEKLPSVDSSLFHDRPIVRNRKLYFVSAHEKPDKLFTNWPAVYSSGRSVRDGEIVRLTPRETADYSPAVSKTGKFIAVASYGSRQWGGEFHELKTEIVVFTESDPSKRVVVSDHGGWPSWCGDSVIYFHRIDDDGWWSVYRVDLADDFETSRKTNGPGVRITPPGVHAFTPAAFHDGNRIAVATRRKDSKFRHIEIFDLQSNKFSSVTALLNADLHHYNPFVSPESGFIGYHRYRGELGRGESRIPHIEPVVSPIKELKMLRLNGSFPSISPDGNLIAFNHNFDTKGGVMVVKSDGSKRWTLLKGLTAFYNSWSPTEKNVIFTSIGPIFQSARTTVQIARLSFNSSDLDERDEINANMKMLTKEETGNNAFPSCSPDGKSIVFRSGRSGHKNLYIMDAVDGEFNGRIQQLTNGPWIDTMPSWSPDGKLIAFSSNCHNPSNTEAFSIYIIKPDGSDLRRVYVAGKEGSSDADRERMNHVCFSRDCEWLLFTSNLGGITAEPVSWPNQFQPYGDLHIARVEDGSGLRRLTWNGYENGTPTWHVGDEIDVGKLCLEGDVGDRLTGEFDEPLWISCDI